MVAIIQRCLKWRGAGLGSSEAGPVMRALTLAVGLLVTGPVFAHPGHEHAPDLRVWKDADGLFEIEASFVLARDHRVQLRKHDGALVWVPLAKLSRADQAWVR